MRVGFEKFLEVPIAKPVFGQLLCELVVGVCLGVVAMGGWFSQQNT